MEIVVLIAVYYVVSKLGEIENINKEIENINKQIDVINKILERMQDTSQP